MDGLESGIMDLWSDRVRKSLELKQVGNQPALDGTA